MRFNRVMGLLLTGAISLGLAVSLYPTSPASAAAGDLNIMSWNLQGRNLTNGELYSDTTSVASKIKASGAEYVGLQEISDEHARALANKLGWPYVETRFEHGGIAGTYREGIAMISKYPLQDYRSIPITPGGRGRQLQWARIVKDSITYYIFNTHLGSDDWNETVGDTERNRQAEFIRNQILTLKDQVSNPNAIYVLGGDMNSRAVTDRPKGWAANTFETFMTDTWLNKNPKANTPDVYTNSDPNNSNECRDANRPECGNTVSIRNGNPGDALNPTIRIDYFFVIHGKESFIRSVHTPLPNNATENEYKKFSDHYPYRIVLGPQSTTTPPPAANIAPVARFTWNRLNGANNPVTLDGGGSTDLDGTIAKWQWTVDGATLPLTASRGNVNLGAGTSKTIKLTVTDNNGAINTTTQVLSLPNRAPDIGAYTPNGVVVPSTQPTLRATGSDPDGDSLSYNFRVTGPSVDISSGWIGNAWMVPAHKLDPGTKYSWTVTVRDPSGATAVRNGSFTVTMLPTSADVTATSSGAGYWIVNTYGDVYAYGDAQFYGTLHDKGVNVSNITGLVRTPDSGGYWLVGSDGGVFAFGNAQFFGSKGGQPLNAPVVGMAATKTGNGYWLVAADGGVFAYGDAQFYGSMGGKPLNAPVVAIAPTPSGNGYWLAAKDGGIFAFGDAPFYGSMGGQPLNYPVSDMDTTPDGLGYWMTAEDGGVFAFGNARFYGSMAGKPLNGRITGMAVTPTAGGYWLNGCDGGIFAFGDAPFYGSNPTFMCGGI